MPYFITARFCSIRLEFSHLENRLLGCQVINFLVIPIITNGALVNMPENAAWTCTYLKMCESKGKNHDVTDNLNIPRNVF